MSTTKSKLSKKEQKILYDDIQSWKAYGGYEAIQNAIKDGDTFTIKDQRDKLYKVRLSDIDAPEIGQPFGRSAKRLLEDLALNKIN